MKLYYIAPSTLPSRAANAVHVAQQCEALASIGAEVTLFARRSIKDSKDFKRVLNETYGLRAPLGRLETYYCSSERAVSWIIAVLAVWRFFRDDQKPEGILSRNLYASFLLGGVFRYPVLFETHQLETGWRKWVQSFLMTRQWITTVAISESLVQCLTEHHGVAPAHPLVLHDAAHEVPVDAQQTKENLFQAYPELSGPWRGVCGYCGHLYPGRGIEVIESMARARPECLFVVIGGTEKDLQRCRAQNNSPNLRFLGFLPHVKARALMSAFDVLLMPYQRSVSIGVVGHDTARWMSPMKMFEYMAAQKPIIASDLPVLGEVLRPEDTALLVDPEDSSAWVAALDRLLDDDHLSDSLSKKAYDAFQNAYTWKARAYKILNAMAQTYA